MICRLTTRSWLHQNPSTRSMIPTRPLRENCTLFLPESYSPKAQPPTDNLTSSNPSLSSQAWSTLATSPLSAKTRLSFAAILCHISRMNTAAHQRSEPTILGTFCYLIILRKDTSIWMFVMSFYMRRFPKESSLIPMWSMSKSRTGRRRRMKSSRRLILVIRMHHTWRSVVIEVASGEDRYGWYAWVDVVLQGSKMAYVLSIRLGFAWEIDKHRTRGIIDVPSSIVTVKTHCNYH